MPVQSSLEFLEVEKNELVNKVLSLKNQENFDMLISVSGLDDTENFYVLYHLFSTTTNKNLVLKVKLDRENPNVDTLSKIYSSADWHERETYDLFGINFANHANLERILMPKDWIGHPLRKDYVLNDPRLSWNER
jgi:NADH-quinone oxidoreductase subunit C